MCSSDLFDTVLCSEEVNGVDNTDYEILLPHLTLLESQLQELWGFPVDERYHHYSFKLKGCSCPYMDNMERLGSGMFFINKKCIVHGSKDSEND